MDKETVKRWVVSGIVALSLVVVAVYGKGYLDEQSKYNDLNSEVDEVTKNSICAQIGHFGTFGHGKGVKGALACEIALRNREFYRNDKVSILRMADPNDVGCKGSVLEWSFDSETLKPCYFIYNVTCYGKSHEHVRVLEQDLRREN